MKKSFCFAGDTLPFQADLDDLKSRLTEIRQLIANYQEVESDLDSPEYVARGNGFCDAKYSEDFLQSQAEKIRNRIAELQRSLQ